MKRRHVLKINPSRLPLTQMTSAQPFPRGREVEGPNSGVAETLSTEQPLSAHSNLLSFLQFTYHASGMAPRFSPASSHTLLLLYLQPCWPLFCFLFLECTKVFSTRDLHCFLCLNLPGPQPCAMSSILCYPYIGYEKRKILKRDSAYSFL